MSIVNGVVLLLFLLFRVSLWQQSFCKIYMQFEGFIILSLSRSLFNFEAITSCVPAWGAECLSFRGTEVQTEPAARVTRRKCWHYMFQQTRDTMKLLWLLHYIIII